MPRVDLGRVGADGGWPAAAGEALSAVERRLRAGSGGSARTEVSRGHRTRENAGPPPGSPSSENSRQ